MPDDADNDTMLQWLPLQLRQLELHMAGVHPVVAAPPAAPVHHPSQKVKLESPKLSAGSDQETWELFLRSWDVYKTGMSIGVGLSSVHLFNCLDQDLRDDVLRANPSTHIRDMTEDDLIAAVKKLAVKEESRLVHRIKLWNINQTPGQGVRNFHAVLKGQAKLCQFKVSCHPHPTTT